jgi:hypothetical protein
VKVKEQSENKSVQFVAAADCSGQSIQSGSQQKKLVSQCRERVKLIVNRMTPIDQKKPAAGMIILENDDGGLIFGSACTTISQGLERRESAIAVW